MKNFSTNFKKIVIGFILLIIILFLLKFIHSVNDFINEDTCVDTGLCAEGLKFGNNILTKEYCLKKHFKWDDKRKECDMAIESRTCREQGYEWITEKGKCSHEIAKDW
ncbi:MAG TPA: hypothetical protein PKI94_04635 [Candidatus Gastranaerophilaceae bacterium]|nr:hypothetical protein [Candidatus Gastranaerophilaceae bacterium]